MAENQIVQSQATGIEVPEYLRNRLRGNIQVRTSIPQLSIRGKMFRVIRDGKEIDLQEEVNGELMPMRVFNVVVYAQSHPRSRVFYADSYSGDTSSLPDCFSLDGEKPDAMSVSPQAESCARCPHNVKGSRVTKSGFKSTACVAQRRLVVAPVGALSDILLLRLPATSMFDRNTDGQPWMAWHQYNTWLVSNGIQSTAEVVTALKFDNVDYPKLVFKMVRYISSDELTIVEQLYDSDAVLRLVRPSDQPTSAAPSEPAESAEPSKPTGAGLAAIAHLIDD